MCSVTPQFSSTRWEAFVYVSRFFVMCVNCCYIQFTSLAKVNVNVICLCEKILWKPLERALSLYFGISGTLKLDLISTVFRCVHI